MQEIQRRDAHLSFLIEQIKVAASEIYLAIQFLKVERTSLNFVVSCLRPHDLESTSRVSLLIFGSLENYHSFMSSSYLL